VRTEVIVRFLSDHRQAPYHDWVRLLSLLDPEMWENLGIMPETIVIDVRSRWDDGLVERLAEAMFVKTMAERHRRDPDVIPDHTQAWRELDPGTREEWLRATRAIVDGHPIDPEDGDLR
jgi:hypothetical protein